jgi:solute carrier family 25 uncoupling protein 8/9
MQTILKLPGFKDDVVTHILSGLGAGFFAVCVGSPVDVVRGPSCSVINYPCYSDLLLQTSY